MKMGDLVVILRGLVVKIISLVVIVKYWELLKEDSKTEMSFGDSQNKQFFLIGKVIVCRVNNCVFYRNLFHSFRYTITIRENMIPKV